MQIEYTNAQSATRPLEIDVESSPYGVYIRRDIKEIEQETENADGEIEKIKMFEYQEAFLSRSEYEIFSGQQVACNINGNDNSSAFENYQNKLNTGVLYTNGKKYKPRYHEDYGNIMKDLETAISLIKTSISELETILQNPELTEEQRLSFTATIQTLQTTLATVLTQNFAVYDETGIADNMVMMNAAEIIALYFFLYAKKEEYFAEYKLEKETI